MATMAQSRAMSPPPSRPKLMRATATAPALATSNASRKDLADLPPSRATTILTRVANSSRVQSERRSSANSTCSSPGLRSPSPGNSPSGPNKEPFEIVNHQSGSYFSFPNFEDFLDDEGEDARSEKSR
ncbi:hypothetical protein F5884DRAFT_850925 [Xylogone sp. PMI_703]|nr:hypothetical protein F5884DRAFT_850925 [Xylogone sp. PMI_703]